MSGKRIGWGAGVWIMFGAFVVFMLAIVALAAFQRFDLVTPDYYAQQIAYQTQIDKMSRTNQLTSQPTVEFNSRDRSLALAIPGFDNPEFITGKLRMFRPSNSSWDREFAIALDTLGTQSIPAENLIGGHWRIKLDWESQGETYYLERSIVIK